MSIYGQLAEQIIREQENIIGPVAIEQAEHVPGVKVNMPKHEVQLEGDEKEVLEKLIGQYRDFFGHVAVEVCRDAVRSMKPSLKPEEIPDILK